MYEMHFSRPAVNFVTLEPNLLSLLLTMRFHRSFILLFSGLFLISPASIHGQHSGRACGTVEYNRQVEAAYPGVSETRAEIEAGIQALTHNPHQLNTLRKAVITIPVVVHVIYHPSLSAQNISYSRVVEQINVLNQDFRGSNPDTAQVPALFKGLVADAQIQFCLATRDPIGNWTDGVTRTQTTKTSFGMGDDALIKSTSGGGHDAWDRDKYLNIWVCNLTGNVLGYTQLPGGPAHLDGLVICYKYFGKTGASPPYHKGRTTTHEVGHWLNLYHIWGDDNGACWGSDYCDDTPNQAGDNYACPTFPHASCSNTSDMYMNYMDYVDDACMFMFTPDQKTRMLAVLASTRSSLLNSDGCSPATGIVDAGNLTTLQIFPLPSTDVLNVVVGLSRAIELKITLIDGLGRIYNTTLLSSSDLHHCNISMTSIPAGVYYLLIEGDGIRESRLIQHIR
jgi:hypothetical protein